MDATNKLKQKINSLGEHKNLILGHVCVVGFAALTFKLSPRTGKQLLQRFKNHTLKHPFLSSAVKFSFLGAYGELLGKRLATGEWDLSFKQNVPSMVYWAGAGCAIKASFSVYFGGVTLLGQSILPIINLRVAGLPIFNALTASYLLNSQFYPMLVKLHSCYNQHVAKVQQNVKLIGSESMAFCRDVLSWRFLRQESEWVDMGKFWFKFHTITPLLPEVYQVIYAAAGCPILGADMGLRTARAREQRLERENARE
eukprot:GCRY01002253.1.p1 GENE.GCRY01002253.1~~GCRY01002253.1.p1  ORF type:complete len:255 (+),score=37.88 GCRY01002253.1:72-836(+)